MEALIEEKQNCVLRRIDIVRWGSDVARQFGIRSLPTLWLYDGQKRVTSDTRDALTRIQKLD